MSRNVATTKEIIQRVSLTAEQVQLELSKSHPDLKLIDKWLWNVRQACVVLEAHHDFSYNK